MRERVILADCCETGSSSGAASTSRTEPFRCPECATEWTKTDTDTYRRGDGQSSRAARASDRGLLYLGAADGHQPNVERCCAKILLSHGERIADGPFDLSGVRYAWQRAPNGCTVCVSRSSRRADSPSRHDPGGRTRPFLVTLSSIRAAR